MATLRDEMLPVVDELRGLPVEFGIRAYSVVIRRRAWPSGTPGLPVGSSPVVTDLELSPAPRVRQLAQWEVDGSGGRYRSGDLRIERITPKYDGGGYTPADLCPVPQPGEDVCYVLTGREGALECTLVGEVFERPFGYAVTVRRVTPPVRG